MVWLSGMAQWEENKPRFESTLAELPPLLTAGVYGQGLVSSSSPIVKVAKWLMLLPIRMQIHAGIDSVTLVLPTYVRTSQIPNTGEPNHRLDTYENTAHTGRTRNGQHCSCGCSAFRYGDRNILARDNDVLSNNNNKSSLSLTPLGFLENLGVCPDPYLCGDYSPSQTCQMIGNIHF